MVESIVGCKWSLQVMALVRQGICRPGQMRRATPGLSTKVLNERLRKLQRFGILTRTVKPVIPPHVEYAFSPFGHRFNRLLSQIDRLQDECCAPTPGDGTRPNPSALPRRRNPTKPK